MKKKLIGRQARRNKARQQANETHARHQWYLELVLAALCGAAFTLSFVVIHMMLTTEWTW